MRVPGHQGQMGAGARSRGADTALRDDGASVGAGVMSVGPVGDESGHSAGGRELRG